MSKKGKKELPKSNMDYLLQKYGLPRSWLARALDLTPGGLDYAQKRGFQEDEARTIEKVLNDLGRLLTGWHYSGPASLAQLFDSTPCSKAWLANDLEMPATTFQNLFARKTRKARTEEVRAIESALHTMGRDLLQFSLPYSMRKRAA